MDRPDLIERALQIVEEVLELHGEARRQHVQDRCAGDAELRREVESLLKQERASDVEAEQAPTNADRRSGEGES